MSEPLDNVPARKVGGPPRWPDDPDEIQPGQTYRMRDPATGQEKEVEVRAVAEMANANGHIVVRDGL